MLLESFKIVLNHPTISLVKFPQPSVIVNKILLLPFKKQVPVYSIRSTSTENLYKAISRVYTEGPYYELYKTCVYVNTKENIIFSLTKK